MFTCSKQKQKHAILAKHKIAMQCYDGKEKEEERKTIMMMAKIDVEKSL